MRLKSKYSFLLLCFPIPLLGIIYFLYPRPNKVIFSPENSPVIEVYTDINKGGNSHGKVSRTKSSLQFIYQIGANLQFPYTGFRIYTSDSSHLNLNKFNEIKLTIKASKAHYIPINLTIKDFKLKNGEKVRILLHYMLEYSPGQQNYTILLSDFKIPTWWYGVNKIDEKKVPEVDFAKISSFDIQCGELVKPSEKGEINLYHVSAFSNPTPMFLKIGTYVLVFNVLCLLIFLFRLKYRVQIVPVPYQSQDVENLSETDLAKIKQYVSQNYFEAITTQSVQMETGIPKSKIPSILKNELNVSLKQLVTSIRLNEAKRLLKTSDLPVNEVANQVGFGNVSHFNRVFKEAEKLTPLEYRKSIK